MEFLIWLESTGFSRAIRESGSVWGYGLILILHGMGMGTVVGLSSVVGLRILGFAPRIPLEPLGKLFPFIWLGFWINFLSGSVLMISHATEMWTNWVIYIKLAAIVVAVAILRTIHTQVFRNPGPGESVQMNAKVLAGTLLFLWAVAITAGRLTAYYGAMVDPITGIWFTRIW